MGAVAVQEPAVASPTVEVVCDYNSVNFLYVIYYIIRYVNSYYCDDVLECR